MPRFDKYGSLDSPLAEDQDVAFLRMNNRLRPDQLPAGDVAYSQNGRMQLDGSWEPRRGLDYFAGNPSQSGNPVTLPFYLYANVNISSGTRSGETVTITTAANHLFVDQTQVSIAGLTGTVNPVGNWLITVTAATTFTFVIPGAAGSETYSKSSPTTGAPLLLEPTSVFGSCKFSDPTSSNAEYIIEAQQGAAYAISLATGASTTIDYPAGITLSAEVQVLQAFNKVYVFRDGATALEWDGDVGGSLAFTKVANGSYTQPKVFTAAGNTAASAGVVTVSETSHGLSVGNAIKIFDNGSTTLPEGEFYDVAAVTSANAFTFFADVDNFSSTSVVLGKAQSQGLGFTHMPAPPWGVYHQRRIITPDFYTTTGTSGSETITDRGTRDSLLFSDVLDADTYDQLQASFRVTAGVADFIQTVHPFTDDNAIAFCRNSLHLINGISGSLSDISINEITREAGLVARRSVVTIGNEIFFLSDNGIYSTIFEDLYNLRGAGLPLSDPIQPIIDRINKEYAKNAVATYHDNRYWIAVPLDDSTENNAILVYNLLNKGWESIDTVGIPSWNVTNLISAGAGDINLLYAVNSTGGIHIVDAREDDVDVLSVDAGVNSRSVRNDASITTRRYTMGVMDRKRFSELELHLESSATNESNATISGIAENLDSTFEINTIKGLYGSNLEVSEDASIPARIGGVRAYGLQIKLQPTQGRPKLRAVRVSANRALQSLTSAS